METTQPLSEDKIKEVLKTCFDPEIPVNIVDLGLIYGIDIKDGDVAIRMTLTALGCPLSSFINEDIQRKVMGIRGVKKVQIDVVWDPPWSAERMSKEARAMLGV
jgi:metal-sulfur cluster biosynthetic enzyme